MNERKFTDEQLIKFNSQGLNDRQIARIFNCASETVRDRRYRLRLKANYGFYKLDNEGMKEARIKDLKRSLRALNKKYNKIIELENEKPIKRF
jgi:hypothetical protein